MRATILILALLLSACDSDNPVTPTHFAKATEECASRGGLSSVSKATKEEEIISCGRYCSKKTGKISYFESVSCNDGTKVDLTWFE